MLNIINLWKVDIKRFININPFLYYICYSLGIKENGRILYIIINRRENRVVQYYKKYLVEEVRFIRFIRLVNKIIIFLFNKRDYIVPDETIKVEYGMSTNMYLKTWDIKSYFDELRNPPKKFPYCGKLKVFKNLHSDEFDLFNLYKELLKVYNKVYNNSLKWLIDLVEACINKLRVEEVYPNNSRNAVMVNYSNYTPIEKLNKKVNKNLDEQNLQGIGFFDSNSNFYKLNVLDKPNPNQSNLNKTITINLLNREVYKKHLIGSDESESIRDPGVVVIFKIGKSIPLNKYTIEFTNVFKKWEYNNLKELCKNYFFTLLGLTLLLGSWVAQLTLMEEDDSSVHLDNEAYSSPNLYDSVKLTVLERNEFNPSNDPSLIKNAPSLIKYDLEDLKYDIDDCKTIVDECNGTVYPTCDKDEYYDPWLTNNVIFEGSNSSSVNRDLDLDLGNYYDDLDEDINHYYDEINKYYNDLLGKDSSNRKVLSIDSSIGIELDGLSTGLSIGSVNTNNVPNTASTNTSLHYGHYGELLDNEGRLLRSPASYTYSPILDSPVNMDNSDRIVAYEGKGKGVDVGIGLQKGIQKLDTLIEVNEESEVKLVVESSDSTDSTTSYTPVPLPPLFDNIPSRPSDLIAGKVWDRDLKQQKIWAQRLDPEPDAWTSLETSNFVTDVKDELPFAELTTEGISEMYDFYDAKKELPFSNLNTEEFSEMYSVDSSIANAVPSIVTTDSESSESATSESILIKESSMFNLSILTKASTSISMLEKYTTLLFSKDVDKDKILYEICKVGNELLKEVEDINSKGYVNTFDLLDHKKYPSLSIILKEIIRKDEKGKSYALSIDDKINITKWGHQILMLIIKAHLRVVTSRRMELEEEVEDKSVLADIYALQARVETPLDNSIKRHYQTRGITITKNVYTGFDTEYTAISKDVNELISVQLAVSTRTYLRLPRYTDYTLSTLNPTNSEIYPLKQKGAMDYRKVEDLINILINKTKEDSLKTIQNAINLIATGLKKSGVKFNENDVNTTFFFDPTPVREFFKLTDEYTLKEVVEKANKMADPFLNDETDRIKALMADIYNNLDNNPENNETSEVKRSNFMDLATVEMSESDINNSIVDRRDLRKGKISETRKDSLSPIVSRTYMSYFTPTKVSVSVQRNMYIIGHYIKSDLPMMKDFNEYKHRLNIVHKQLSSVKGCIFLDNSNVYIRDTYLLVPGGSKSLKAIGELYGDNMHKVSIDKNQLVRMKKFQQEQPELFKEYAMQDSKITLFHAMYMEEVCINQGGHSVPLTLAAVSKLYINKKWKADGYEGYQVSHKYLIGETANILTPKGITATGKVGRVLPYFIEAYKGGRNESFMYGRVRSEDLLRFYDYDLHGAYPTGMALLGDPDYKATSIISVEMLNKMSNEEILFSYLAIAVKFKYPSGTKYPAIPTPIDSSDNSPVYALEGEAVITGADFLLARYMKCELVISEIAYVPFKRKTSNNSIGDDFKDSKGSEITAFFDKLSQLPFRNCVKDLLKKRNEHPKGSLNNLIYKNIANSLYGLTGTGISNKMITDPHTNTSERLKATPIANVLICNWITSYIRAIIGEILHNISLQEGYVVSVTTDGFITNIPGLEKKLLDDTTLNCYLLKSYKEMRKILTGNDVALELKCATDNILSWTTRGQWSFDNGSSGISAITGFSRKGYSNAEVNLILHDTWDKNKIFESIRENLRSASSILKTGGHMNKTFTDVTLRLHYDNRRIVGDDIVMGELRDSRPVLNKDEAKLQRYLAKLSNSVSFHKNIQNTSTIPKGYKDPLDVLVRGFIRGVFNNDYNLTYKAFTSYQELADFVNSYDNSLNISANYIAQLKARATLNKRKKVIDYGAYDDPKLQGFLDHITTKFPDFEREGFKA